jgi:nucleoside-diphosphate-sugar epimerase
VDFAAVRYGAAFGPWSGPGGGGPSNVMRAALRAAMVGDEAVLPAGGLEWVYSKDAALGTVLALNVKSLPSRIFNITMGALLTAEQLAAAFATVFPSARIRIETPAVAAVALPDMRSASDLSLAQSVLGYTPRFGVVEALRDFADWMKTRSER